MAVNGLSRSPSPSIGSTPPPSSATNKPDTQGKTQQPQPGSAAPGKKDEFVQPSQKKDPVNLSGGFKGPAASVRTAAANGNPMAKELVEQADKVNKEIMQMAMSG